MTSKKTILFVDDDIKRTTSYVDVLELEGYKILAAHTIGKAREDFEKYKDRIDLIILDLMMPAEKYDAEATRNSRKTGLRFLDQIREISKKLPVILFSVIRYNDVKNEVDTAGISDYLEKPCRPSKLIEAVEETIGESNNPKKKGK